MRENVILEEVKGFEFLFPSRFVDDDAELLELGQNVFVFEEVEACGENGGFNDSVFGSIKAEERTMFAARDNLSGEDRAVVIFVEIGDAELERLAAIDEPDACNDISCHNVGECTNLSNGPASDQENIVGDVKDTFRDRLEILEGGGCLEGTEDEFGQIGSHDRPHGSEVDRSVERAGGDEAFEDHEESLLERDLRLDEDNLSFAWIIRGSKSEAITLSSYGVLGIDVA